MYLIILAFGIDVFISDNVGRYAMGWDFFEFVVSIIVDSKYIPHSVGQSVSFYFLMISDISFVISGNVKDVTSINVFIYVI